MLYVGAGPSLLARALQVLGNCVIPLLVKLIVFRVTTTLALAAGLVFASLSSAQTSDGRPPANEFVRQIIDNELQAEKNDHSHWILRLETRKSGKTEVREVVETKDGDLDWLISVNGKPLPDDQRRERERGLQRLISNPADLKKSQREQDEDQARSQRLLKLLPDALVFEYGEQRGDLVELKFKPNPHFGPPSHEAAVVHTMEGVLWVNGKQKRLVEISGHLTRPVKFRWWPIGAFGRRWTFLCEAGRGSARLLGIGRSGCGYEGQSAFLQNHWSAGRNEAQHVPQTAR